MKITEIDQIDVDDRVLSIGQYNAIVVFCPFCYPKFIDLGIREIIGFGTDDLGYVVEVSECPNCFEKSHHHLPDLHTYKIYKHFKQRGQLNSQKL
jgi:hypothetical protein